MPNKTADKPTPKRRRASLRYSPSDSFEAALDTAAHRHVGEALSRRWAQMTVDDLVLRAIRAANAVDHDLPLSDFAGVVTAMLAELVANGAVDGDLPSEARLQSIVLRHLKNGRSGKAPEDDPDRSDRPK